MKFLKPPGCYQWGKPFHRALPEISTLLCVIVILFQFLLFVHSSHAIEGQAQEPTPAKESVQLRERWGIEVTSLKLTAAGHMVDFRYRVTDPIKALPLFDPKGRPTLIDQASGTKLNVPVAPKVGSLRQKTMKPEVGRIYFILFGNTGVVKDGSKVTLVIGDVKIEDLTVEGEGGTMEPSAVQDDYTDPRKTIEVAVGREFTIVLGANRTTGYLWDLARPLDRGRVELVRNEYKIEQEGGKVGAGGQEVWTFKAIGEGKTKIAMKYVRPWEKNTAGVKTVTFEIDVKK